MLSGLLEITGTDGSARRVRCRVTFAEPVVRVSLPESVSLSRAVRYRMVLLHDDGTPFEEVSPLETGDVLVQPLSIGSLQLLVESDRRGV